MARPTDYSEQLAEKICETVASSPYGLKQICEENPDFPSRDTIYKWKFRYKSFSDMYDNAKRIQADILAESITDISDDKSSDIYFDDHGNKRIDSGSVAHRKLMVDTRKWLASKMLPKVYGDKQVVENNHKFHEDDLKALK